MADRQTDRRARAASNERVGSTQGRRSGDLPGGGTHSAGRRWSEARGSHQPRPRAGNDESHPRETKMSGFGAIRSFPAPFLPAPPTARAAHQLSPLPWAHPRARASRPRAHESPRYIPPCRYFLHHLCPSVVSPWLHLKPFQGRDPGAAAYTNLVNATHFCPGYQSKMSLQRSTFIKALMELESSHQKARWLVFLCY